MGPGGCNKNGGGGIYLEVQRAGGEGPWKAVTRGRGRKEWVTDGDAPIPSIPSDPSAGHPPSIETQGSKGHYNEG